MYYINQTGWYGNWSLVIASIILASFIFFVFIAFPKKIDWKTFGLTEAFIISLFTEMFGIPFTIYIISSLLKIEILPTNLTGHLWATLLSLYGIINLETGVFLVMLISVIMILIGLILVIGGWVSIYKRKETIVMDGFYSYVRHPQYLGFIIIISGFIIQWPTFLTLVMYPILVYLYYKQAIKEEHHLLKKFGNIYFEYTKRVPRFNIIKGLLKKK